ncbi:hypothetical protein [Clostridium sardiniense]|uniref:hypothetical protein n=1 Tax=Clostridium sardiniense TaxID=29369 RepID=UPI00195BFD06|nr:hypothetical protein [Clostridium sardiniense]MBM7833087.1 hypothetical protein [Clostridium sardiniense]
MVKLAYLSLLLGFFIKIFLFIKEFHEVFSKKKEKHTAFISFLLCSIYGIVDIMVSIGCGLYGIEIFLIK